MSKMKGDTETELFYHIVQPILKGYVWEMAILQNYI